MNARNDLDRIDRLTLRGWRATNLIGWWFVGTAVYHAMAIVLVKTFVQKIAFNGFGMSVPMTPLALELLVLDFAAVTAGAIVGSRVYRSPFLVAGLAVLLPESVVYLFLVAGSAIPELAILALYSVVPAVLAGIAARFVWRRRPRALRVAA